MDTGAPDDGQIGPYAVERPADSCVVHLAGDIDAASAPALRTQLAGLVEESPARLRLDMAEVEFLDSVGISVLVSAFNRAAERGVAFEVAAVPAKCLRVFEITRLTDVFTIVP